MRPSTEYRDRLVPYEKTVIEKRAPTDESIRLYEEMKEKAHDSLLDGFKIENNILSGSCCVWRDYQSGLTVIGYRALLNGREPQGKVEVEDYLGREDAMRRVYSRMAEAIAAVLMLNSVSELKDVGRR